MPQHDANLTSHDVSPMPLTAARHESSSEDDSEAPGQEGILDEEGD